MRAIVIDPPATWAIHDLDADDLAVICGHSPHRIGLSPHLILRVDAAASIPNPLASALLPTLGLRLEHLCGTAVIGPARGTDLPTTSLDTLTNALAVLSTNDILLTAHAAAISITRQWGNKTAPSAALSK